MREVRNALQHPGHRSRGDAFHITTPFLAEVQALLEHLRNPPTAHALGVPRKRIKTAELGDRIGDLARAMKSGGFSHLPILDDDGVIIGVFNEAAVFDYLWAEPETIIGREMELAEILPHCRLDANHTEGFEFVSPRTTLEDIIEMFVAIQSPTTRTGAAFVTASGSDREPLQRMITPWDVLATANEPP